MRTHHRRSLAFAATCMPALIGIGLVAGAQPALAADCGATSTMADGQLDADQLQACLLEQVQSSLDTAAPVETPVAESGPEANAWEVAVADVVPAPVYDALDLLSNVEAEVATLVGPVEPPAEEAAPAPAESGLGGSFAALRDCESGGDYSIDTGNGYYGAYQFSLDTWQGLGYGGYPQEASPGVQDQAAAELQSLYGWGQWPACSWYLGLA
ncbi:MAG: resuscitation-promoting factor RpfB [Actinomycetota bacterium]|nr:resuscitation-promoting factor RpfB [Actinomycetota bacterium]